MTLAEKLREEGKLEGKLEHARNVLIILAQDKFGLRKCRA